MAGAEMPARTGDSRSKRAPGKASEARNPLAIALGIRLRELRKSRGLKQDQLANRCDLHRTEISLLELGLREPRLAQIIKLAGSLEVEPGTLVDGLFRYEPASVGPKARKGSKKKPGRFVRLEVADPGR